MIDLPSMPDIGTTYNYGTAAWQYNGKGWETSTPLTTIPTYDISIIPVYGNMSIGDLLFPILLASTFSTSNIGDISVSILTTADPYYSSVTLLIHGDSESLTNADSSPATRTYSNPGTGTSTIGVGAGRFGYGAWGISGYDAYTKFTSHTGTVNLSGDFTIEFFIQVGTWGGDGTVISMGYNINILNAIAIAIYATNVNVTIAGQEYTYSVSGGISVGSYYHIAYCRSGTNLLTYIDGIEIGNEPFNVYETDPVDIIDATTIVLGGNPDIGGSTTSTDMNIDEIRVTVGTARYTSAFTPTSNPFPNY